MGEDRLWEMGGKEAGEGNEGGRSSKEWEVGEIQVGGNYAT